MDFHKRFKELVKEYKTENPNTTQAQIAESVGLTPQAFSYYLNGREPNYEILIKLANYFDVTVDYLIGNSDYRNASQKKIAEEFGLTKEAALQLSMLQKVDQIFLSNGKKAPNNAINTFNILLTHKSGQQILEYLNLSLDAEYCVLLSSSLRDGFSDFVSESETVVTPRVDSRILLNKVTLENLELLQGELFKEYNKRQSKINKSKVHNEEA